jgi:hypothetical protein
MMKVKLKVVKNKLDHTQKMYLIIGIPNKTIDGVEYIPVIEDPNSRRLHWVRKDAFEEKPNGTKIEVEIDA